MVLAPLSPRRAGAFAPLLAIVFLLLAYLGFVLTFGVNVPFWDDWELLDATRQVALGQTEWWKLAASRHNEHLIGTAFLLQSLQLLATGFQYKLLLVTGVALQVIAFILAAAGLWRWIPERRRPLWLSTAAAIWFSLAQSKNLLWPFQTAWFLVSVLLGIALLMLRLAVARERRSQGSGAWFSLAVAAAFAASFTSSQGIIVWLAGLMYLAASYSFSFDEMIRSKLMRRWAITIGVAVLLIGIVWFRTNNIVPEGNSPLSLGIFLYIVAGIHGDFWGNLGVRGLPIVGVGMLAFVGLALLQVFFSKARAAYALPFSFIAFGLGFTSLVALGRARFNIGPASDSHYTAYLVFTFSGVLSVLARRDPTVPSFFRKPWFGVYSCILLLATFASAYDAVLQGIRWRADQGLAVAALLQYKEEPDFVLERLLFGNAVIVRRNAEFLEEHRFGPFGQTDPIPIEVRSYASMPKSLGAMMISFPRQQEAIRRAWQVYQAGSDLRNAFSPVSEKFAQNLIGWCAEAAQKKGHYLSAYLVPFSTDYTEIRKTFQASGGG